MITDKTGKKYKVVAVTPAGRKSFLEILSKYSLNNRDLIDEHHLWFNTSKDENKEYIHHLAEKHSDFFKIISKGVVKNPQGKPDLGVSIWQYYQECVDKDTIYIKIDDDIVYFAPDAIKNLLIYRLKRTKPLLIYGNIINNALCSHVQQKRGIIPMKWGEIKPSCLMSTGWGDPLLAEKIHRLFLKDVKWDRVKRWKFKKNNFGYERFSINVICWFGREIRKIKELKLDSIIDAYDTPTDERAYNFYHSDEGFFTQDIVKKIGVPNEICGGAIFSHFSFYVQNEHLMKTNILDEYRDFAFERNNNNKVRSIIIKAKRIFRF